MKKITSHRNEDEGYEIRINGKPSEWSVKNRPFGWEIHLDGNWDRTFETKRECIDWIKRTCN